MLLRQGNLNLIAGMNWHFQSDRRERALRILARNDNASLFTFMPALNAEGVLLGTADTDLKKRKGPCYSLALLALPLLKQHGDNGVAVVPLGDDTWWFVALNKGELSVLSDVTGSRDEMIAGIDEFKKFHTQKEMFTLAPAGFFSQDISAALTVEDILKSLTGIARWQHLWRCRLRPVSRQKQQSWLLGLILLALAGGYTWHYVVQQQEAERLHALKALMDKRKAARHKTIPVSRPWLTQSRPADFIGACAGQWKTLPLAIEGWTLNLAECGPRDTSGDRILMTRYARGNHGTVAGFLERLPHYYPVTPEFDIPGAGSTAQFVLPVPVRPARHQDKLIPEKRLLQWLVNYAQRLDATVTIQPLPVGEKIPLPWRQFTWTLKTDIPPEHLFTGDIPDGFRVSKVSFARSPDRIHYVLNGDLYAAH